MPPTPDRTLAAPWRHLLRATVVEASWTPDRPWAPPPDVAIRVRGAVGWGFTQATCVRPPRDCAPCELRTSCLVPTWYEQNLIGGHQQRPFSIAVTPPPEVSREAPLVARLVLYGDLLDRALMLSALRFAGAMLGPETVRHTLTGLRAWGAGDPAHVVGRDAESPWPDAATLDHLVCVPEAPSGARVVLLSPLQADDPRRSVDLTSGAFLERCIRRVQALATHQRVALPVRWPSAADLGRWRERRWVQKAHWAQRPHEQLNLSGWRGELEFGPEIAPFADLLAVAELASVGRQTSYGLGAVALAWS